MIKVGLTGGIGSGKSTVAKIFNVLQVPIYCSDVRAKVLMNSDNTVKSKIIAEFGTLAYNDNQLNRSYLANVVFSDKEKLQRLNGIVHPAVRADYQRWLDMYSEPYSINESAILIESGLIDQMDYVICVVASDEVRIRRVVDRDKVSEEDVKARMKNQLTDKERLKFAHFVISNTNELLIAQVQNIDKKLWEISQSGSAEV
ncbi:MAG: dephospho-CoA kinase [Salinivirgaceae bacterium]|jgi:dephospho-CoA kinase|nr:dephospho-CoA kinase [Salinivirgaceae bacterium]MDY0280959.1 dephospho-CoA kinase [Salinivirgaceae bacterium]